jgi:hypothetical protein
LENNLKSSACPVAAWRSGHRIRLKNWRPGFESSQGVRFYVGKHSNAAVYYCLNMHCLCVEKEKKVVRPNKKIDKTFFKSSTSLCR